MEPMALGSPSGSPALPYLPPFLMGESNTPSTPRSNTLSPTKRSISFAQSPGQPSPGTDFNRSSIGQKTLFGYQQSAPSFNNYPGTPNQNQHNSSISGPPTQGLFDSLRSEQNQVQTPTRNFGQNQSLQIGTPITAGSYQASFNDSHLNSSNINNSRITSPVVQITNINANDYRTNQIKLNYDSNLILHQQCVPQKYSDFWITVYGFPQSATTMILSHFSQCGTIIDKVFSPQNGNWIHLKFSSRLESDRALNYNEKILGNNIMIGVTHCKDSNIIDKENVCENNQQFSRVRPLTQAAYNCVQDESAVVTSPNAPQRSSGMINKAMDILFGW